jgi:Leucine-rich repeat (LRR) protein
MQAAVPLDRVESMTLANNDLTSIPDGYFAALPNLTHIDLSFNEGPLRKSF